MSCAPDSRPDGAMQRSDKRLREYLRAKTKRSLPVLRDMMLGQQQDGHGFSVIVPVGSPLLEEPAMEEIISMCPFQTLIHLCAHGFRDPGTGGHIKRPMLIHSSHRLRSADRQCPGFPHHDGHRNLSLATDLPFAGNSTWCPGLCSRLACDSFCNSNFSCVRFKRKDD